jgi:hypothetical protein
MRGNEIVEDILIITVATCLIPIGLVLLLVFGVALLYTWPLILITLVVLLVLRFKKHEKTLVTMGRVKPLVFPVFIRKTMAIFIHSSADNGIDGFGFGIYANEMGWHMYRGADCVVPLSIRRLILGNRNPIKFRFAHQHGGVVWLIWFII